jgi:hypothetical protein
VIEDELTFLSRRVREEGEAARRASEPCAARTHYQMQAEYRRRLEALPENIGAVSAGLFTERPGLSTLTESQRPTIHADGADGRFAADH